LPGVLSQLSELTGDNRALPECLSSWRTQASEKRSQELEALFNAYGSDKARHGYHHVYAPILKNPSDVKRILEVGLGTNNVDVVSHMGVEGQPGASLRALRDYCPKAQLYGADVDDRILFDDERITTHHVDQRDSNSLDNLAEQLPDGFDLVIDDGLHTPDANIGTLLLGLRLVKPGGWVIIEDIKPSAEKIWQVVAQLLPQDCQPHLVHCNYALLFAVQRKPAQALEN
jgi:hypothetical protein